MTTTNKMQVAVRLWAGRLRARRARELAGLRKENALLRRLKAAGVGLIFGWALALGAVELTWDPSPDAAWVTGYRVYCGTNSVSVHHLTNAPVKVDAGTNLSVTIDGLQGGRRYYFVATAYGTNGLESLPSNEVTWAALRPPGGLRTVIVQWIGDILGTNWTDVGYFRLKITP